MWSSDKDKWEAYSLEGFQYDEDGHEIYNSLRYLSDDDAYYIRTSTYDSNGRLLVAITDYKEDNKIVRDEYMYDDAGNLVGIRNSTNDESTTTKRWYFSEAKGIEKVQGDNVQTIKLIRNGQLYIMYKGTKYNVQGLRIGD